MRSTPLKVCFPFIGDEVGGSHISALKLVAHLDRNIVSPVIALHHDGDVLADYIRKEGLDYCVLPDVNTMVPGARRGSNSLNMWGYAIHSVPALRNFLLSHSIDVVHTNDGQIHSTWAVPTRLAGAKLLWHHRADPQARGVNLIAPLLAHHIATVSEFSKPARPILAVKNRISVVHSPFEHPATIPDRTDSRALVMTELNCARDALFVGYFGGLIERKRPVGFVDIVAKLRHHHPSLNVHGLLFGEAQRSGPALDVAVTSRARDLGISDRIHLMGFRQPIDAYMTAVDVMLVPALNEPFGRTLIESMMLGTPVVATRHGGNIEAIEDRMNGFLVEPDNADQFVAPVHALLTDKTLWTRISRVAQQNALARFSVETHVEGIMHIYRKLAGSKILEAAP